MRKPPNVLTLGEEKVLLGFESFRIFAEMIFPKNIE